MEKGTFKAFLFLWANVEACALFVLLWVITEQTYWDHGQQANAGVTTS